MNNNCIYFPGDIISVKNIIFKDTNTIDTRLNGHPMMVLNKVSLIGDKVYLLKLSGSYGAMDQLKNFYPLKNIGAGLRKASYIDLRYVYERKCNNIQPVAFVSTGEYEKIIKALSNKNNGVKQDEEYLAWLNSVC